MIAPKIMMKGANSFFAVAKISATGVLLLLLLCVRPVEARKTSVAFCSLSPLDQHSVGRARWSPVEPSKTIVLSKTKKISRTNAVLFMAAPGMSEERRKEERDAEIRATISKLKRDGRMQKNKDGTQQSAEETAMLEAEAFFSKPSPVRKFEAWTAERKRVLEAEAEAERKRQDDEQSESSD
jgi:hypothetical protein